MKFNGTAMGVFWLGVHSMGAYCVTDPCLFHRKIGPPHWENRDRGTVKSDFPRCSSFFEVSALFYLFLSVVSDKNRFGHNDSPRRIDPRIPAAPKHFFYDARRFWILIFSDPAQGLGLGPGPGTRARARDPGPGPGPEAQGPGPGSAPWAGTQGLGTGPGHGA